MSPEQSNNKIHFRCPKCNTKYAAQPKQAGKKGSCKNCGAEMMVPKYENSPSVEGVNIEVSSCCENCGSETVERGYDLKLCPKCRETLANRPFPAWIKVMLGIIAILLVLALARFPDSLKAGIAFERGKRAEIVGDYARAAIEYKKVVAKFPNSALSLARLGIAYYRAGHFQEAADIFDKISGRETSKELADEVNRAIEEMESMIK